MKKLWLILLIITALSTVSAKEEPYVKFTSFQCNDVGELYFQADYEWDFYKGGYVYLNSVKINAIVDGKPMPIEGWWFKFKTRDFVMSDIKPNSPTAHFFSKKESLKEGSYEVRIDYTISKNGIKRFEKQFIGSVRCPKQREKKEFVKEEKPLSGEEKEGLKEVVESPAEEPQLFNKNSKNYVTYYVISLLVVIFIASTFIAKKFYKKHSVVKKKLSSRNVENLFERKS